jgi:hypothetical protein
LPETNTGQRPPRWPALPPPQWPGFGPPYTPRGAHRVLQVRTAMLDGRFGQQAIQLAA